MSSNHIKNLPGHKTDVQDCQWLHAHALLHKSFVAPEKIRTMRSYSRLRDDHLRTSAMYVQLMQKALDQLNVKLHTAKSALDLMRWRNAKAFTSWLGLVRGKNQSGKKRRRARHRPRPMAGQIFQLAAQSVGKSRYLALGGFYRRLKARTNSVVATMATARKLAVLFYEAMRHGLANVERGLEACEAANRLRQRRYLEKCAEELGLILIPTHAQTE